MKTARNANIELLRICLMFGIFILHAIYHSGNQLPAVSNCLRWCVNCFVFISGWYGIQFSLSRLLRFVATVAYAGVVAIAVGVLVGTWNPSDNAFLSNAYKMIVGHWFVVAYVILMLVAPLVNSALEKISSEKLSQILLPFVFLLFWSWSQGLPLISTALPLAPGFGDYTPLSLIGVYVCARVMRMLKVDVRVDAVKLLVVLCACAPVCFWGFGTYSSFFAILVAGSVFLLFERCPIQARIERIVTILSPSMFSMLILSQKAGWTLPLFNRLNGNMVNQPIYLKGISALSLAGLLFAGCLLLDVPRRAFCYVFHEALHRACKYIDAKYYIFCVNLCGKLGFSVGGGVIAHQN